jgi:hypothetical protein
MFGAMEASTSQGSTPERLGAALDPRARIYRDPFNELVVFVLSAAGAGVLVPVVLLVVGAFVGEIDFWIFVGASVVLELALIFGLARPQMKPLERVGWALLWGFAAAALGAAFWELVFQPSI